MDTQNSADFSSFKVKLSPQALACFRALFGSVHKTIQDEGPQQAYETPINDMLALNEIEDVESVAQSIREIIQCKVELKHKECLYFFPFFSSIKIEKGIIYYSVHDEIENAVSLLPAPFHI